MRSGTPRIWLVDSLGASPALLETGSASFIPERAPAWSPAGDRIAFTSVRTGTSQVFVVAAGGGAAIQLSRETGGAFDPVWVPGGDSILYSTARSPSLGRASTSLETDRQRGDNLERQRSGRVVHDYQTG